ncbi:MAG TPA: hypothetical protein VFP72_03960 [Kineosporiaceae bacterium]|nr:hypothetical protein [Kineosporiaceae bacterium]
MTESRAETGSPRGGFNGWWLGSAMFVLAVLVAAVLVVVLGGGSGSTPGNAPTSTGTASGLPGTADSSAGTSGCAGSAGNANVPTVQPPSGIRWEVLFTIAVPWSSDAGPAVRDGAHRRCYQHSPVGALLAAANLAVTTQCPGSDRTLRDQVLPGPTRDAMLKAAQTQPPQAKQPGETAALAGYRFLAYSPNVTVLQLAYTFGGKYGMENYRLEWHDGDWMLNLDPPGGSVPGQPLTSLAGFVPWGAV